MVPLHPLLFFLSFLPLARSDVSFPLTAISHYSELSPCGVSHVSRVLDETLYQGCTSATPISAYGSCLCAQRLRSVQKYISINFEYDYECSSTGVQPYLTAFCAQWGVDIAAAEKSKPSSTTTVSGGGDAAETGKGTYIYPPSVSIRASPRNSQEADTCLPRTQQYPATRAPPTNRPQLRRRRAAALRQAAAAADYPAITSPSSPQSPDP